MSDVIRLVRERRASHSYRRFSALEIECDFGVNAIVGDFSVVHFGSELLDVERTNIPQRLGRLIYRALRGVFLTLR